MQGQGRLILPAGQASFAPGSVCGRANAWSWADQTDLDPRSGRAWWCRPRPIRRDERPC